MDAPGAGSYVSHAPRGRLVSLEVAPGCARWPDAGDRACGTGRGIASQRTRRSGEPAAGPVLKTVHGGSRACGRGGPRLDAPGRDTTRVECRRSLGSVGGARHRATGRALAYPEASRRRQRSEESDLRAVRDTLFGKCTSLHSGRESPLLIGIPVGHLVGYMIGDDERVRVPGNQIHPVDAQKVHEDRRIRHDHCRRRRSHEMAHSPRAASARRRRTSAFMPSILPSSRTRPREISSRRYASMAR